MAPNGKTTLHLKCAGVGTLTRNLMITSPMRYHLTISAILCCIMLCHIVSFLYYVVLCHIMLPCCIMLYYAVSCIMFVPRCIKSYNVVLCCIMFCMILCLSGVNDLQLSTNRTYLLKLTIH